MAYKHIEKPVMKKDAMNLLLGKPVYVDDITSQDCLVVKVLRSPHAHALIEEIDVSKAQKIPGIEAVYTCLLYTSPSPRDVEESRMPSSA